MVIKRPCYMLSIWITICLPLISVLLYYYLFDPFLKFLTFVVYRIRYLLIARMLRLIRLLMHVQQYRAFVATFLTLIPSLMPYLGTIFCILCVYCSLGVQVHQCWSSHVCFLSFYISFSSQTWAYCFATETYVIMLLPLAKIDRATFTICLSGVLLKLLLSTVVFVPLYYFFSLPQYLSCLPTVPAPSLIWYI